MDSIADEAVVATNDYAAICKYQAVIRGYYSDPFLEKFLSSRVKSSTPRKAPEINRGYYARSTSVAFIVEKFIESHPNGQIISLGAGYDTLYWRLKKNNLLRGDSDNQGDSGAESINYVEIDMSSVVVHKIMSIRRNPELYKLLSTIRYKGEGLHSDDYHLISFDLRQVDKTPLKTKLIEDCHIDLERPTLCLSECVFVFMPLQDSNSLIRWLSDNFDKLTMVIYEQCNMEDKFAEVMLANMNARHCDLMGVEACKSLDCQTSRLKSNGLIYTKGWTIMEILDTLLLPDSVERIFKIEFLDEKELLEQLLEHYSIVIGSHNQVDWIPETDYWLSKTTS